MASGGIKGKIYQICEWVMRFACLNILWILFSISGLIVFGIFPSTAAMFTVVRKWNMGEEDIPLFSTFWTAYKSEFLRVNMLGVSVILLGFIWIINLRYLSLLQDGQGSFTWLALMIMMVILTVVLLYFFPVFVHFELKYFQYLKYTLIIGFSFPLQTFLMAVSTIVLYFSMTLLPGLFPFFSGSLFSFTIMWIALKVFRKIKERQKLNTDEMNTAHLDDRKRIYQ